MQDNVAVREFTPSNRANSIPLHETQQPQVSLHRAAASRAAVSHLVLRVQRLAIWFCVHETSFGEGE